MQYGVNLTKTELNMEFENEVQENNAYKYSNILPNFNPNKANNIDFVGNIKVGEKVSNNIARHILVLTSWRSGSSFLGDLLNQYKGSFYYFEPLHYYAFTSSMKDQSKSDFIKSLFNCNFTNENSGFLQHCLQGSFQNDKRN